MDLTPAMKQYVEIKEQHKDCILLFRMGDFYEMFFEDAVAAAKVLDITLTSRNKGKEDSIPLCGFPYHAASTYISKLINSGFKVAICEQMEDPKNARGVVKREVVRIVTPGLVVDNDNLATGENNFLAALTLGGTAGVFGMAFLDISTGEFRVTESRDRDFFLNEVSGLDFREVIVQENDREGSFLKAFLHGTSRCRINYFAPEYFDHDDALTRLQEYFSGDQLKQIEAEKHPAMVAAAGAILLYVEETQKNTPRHINDIQWYKTDGYLILDETAKYNLELFTTIAGDGKQGTLFRVLNETVTSMGARRLRWWLNYPLAVPEKIRERLSALSEIKGQHLLRESLRKSLRQVYDLERLGSRISMGVANGRDLVALKTSLQVLPEIKSTLRELESSLITSIYAGIDEMPDILGLIEKSIVEDPPLTLRDGGIIKEGYDQELDELISVMRDGKQWIAVLEEKERKRTGINSLKVGFNSVFGYYIEVTRANAGLVPDDYIRKQTLVNAERYINQELKGYEYTVLNAENLRKEKEYNLFVMIRDRIGQEIRRIQTTASHIAELDALVSLAEVAEKYNYICPTVDEGGRIEITDGRHPVVERMPLPDGFVPNDTFLELDRNRLLVITGPNMAGKSTYIRQVALIVVLAQMGSFVPAAKAHIGVADRIFTRIGAADSLAKGQSTFMVEMNEVAGILKNATSRSLIILDEVGRGTSTFDGLSIAWAVAEYIHDTKQARTLFATHYHQLTDLAITKSGVKNYNIAVKEWGNSIIFLRKIMEGGTNRSYGIAVARIAGVPDEVILRAREILENLEKGELDEIGIPKIARGKKAINKGRGQLSLFMGDENMIIAELKGMNVMDMTPLEALNLLAKWRDRIDKGRK
ncbi:MAG: DNA mismatch repair protein MutS [Syntrophales bacterium]